MSNVSNVSNEGNVGSVGPMRAERPSSRGRGRPTKFGRPSRVVALTLPEDVIEALTRIDADAGWAIVKLLEQGRGGTPTRPTQPDVERVTIAARRSLIVVNRAVFTRLPGVNIIPLTDTRAFLALDAGRGISDLELAVIDELADRELAGRERQALLSLRQHLSAWRHDRGLAFHTRAIIVVEDTGRQKHTVAGAKRRTPVRS